jgi:hypothetical protein
MPLSGNPKEDGAHDPADGDDRAWSGSNNRTIRTFMAPTKAQPQYYAHLLIAAEFA